MLPTPHSGNECRSDVVRYRALLVPDIPRHLALSGACTKFPASMLIGGMQPAARSWAIAGLLHDVLNSRLDSGADATEIRRDRTCVEITRGRKEVNHVEIK